MQLLILNNASPQVGYYKKGKYVNNDGVGEVHTHSRMSGMFTNQQLPLAK
jgi:hypothetical protein